MKEKKTNLLTERQRLVLETMRMRLTEKEALGYLLNSGFEISDTTWYREKNKLENMKLERLYHIAKIGLGEQHLERIDKCELIEKLMWNNFLQEKDPFKRTVILREIVRMQPYISSYYEATYYAAKQTGDNAEIPSISTEGSVIPLSSNAGQVNQ